MESWNDKVAVKVWSTRSCSCEVENGTAEAVMTEVGPEFARYRTTLIGYAIERDKKQNKQRTLRQHLIIKEEKWPLSISTVR